MAFQYIAGANFFPAHGGLGMYLRYGDTGTEKIEIIEECNDHIWIKAPDREIILVSNTHHKNSYRPVDSNWDEFISVSAFFKTFKDFGIDWLMTNMPQHLSKMQMSPNHCYEGAQNQVNWLADSGGFQILSGKIEYLDPAKVQQWYNENTDVGVVLDIPSPVDDKSILKECAKVQKRNTDVMLQHKADHVELMNVLHGTSVEGYDYFRKFVERPEIENRVCLAGLYHGNIVKTTSDILHILTSGHKYSHYHILGIYNLGIMPVLIRMGNMGFCDLLTSDSSTHIQSAMSRLYHHQKNIDSGMERLMIGMESKVRRPNPYRTLPCSCPVCSRIKYTDILAILGGTVPPYFIMMHNMYEIARYIKSMNYYAAELDDQDYLELVKSQLKTHAARKDTEISLELLRYASEHGAKKARNTYRYYIGDKVSIGNLTGSLHKESDITSDQLEGLDKQTMQQRIVNALDVYRDPKLNKHVVHGRKPKKSKDSKYSKDSDTDKSAKSKGYGKRHKKPGGSMYNKKRNSGGKVSIKKKST